MEKKLASFRLSAATLMKLEAIQKWETEMAEIHGYPASSKTDILEKAIKELYNNMINKTQDADVIERIDDVIESKIKAAMKYVLEGLDQIVYSNKRNEIYWNVLSKTKIIPELDELNEERKRSLLEKESKLSTLIDEYIYQKETK